MYCNRSALLKPDGGWTGFPVKGLIGPPLLFVNDARRGACPDGSMTRTNDPSGSVYSRPSAPVVARDGRPERLPSSLERLVDTTTPLLPPMKVVAGFAALAARRALIPQCAALNIAPPARPTASSVVLPQPQIG